MSQADMNYNSMGQSEVEMARFNESNQLLGKNKVKDPHQCVYHYPPEKEGDEAEQDDRFDYGEEEGPAPDK